MKMLDSNRSFWIFSLSACLLMPLPALTQTGSVSGSVRDADARNPIHNVQVELIQRNRTIAIATTDDSGVFSFSSIPPGTYILLARRLNFLPHRIDELTVREGEQTFIAPISLVQSAVKINPVVVSASRTAESALDAPASVSVVETETIERRNAVTAADHIAGLPGVDLAHTGLTQDEVVTRGFSNVASGAFLVLSDHRQASMPSLRINAFDFIPVSSEDIERIEIVRGPGAALYGPNTANGVMHIITRSPFDSPGTTISLTGGERALLMGTLRHASSLSEAFAFKISAQGQRGTEWPHQDPQETLTRDSTVERMSAEARMDYRFAQSSEIVTSFGFSQAFRNIVMTPLGAAQVRNWRHTFGQTRLTSGKFFAQMFVNGSNATETVLLRGGAPIVDRSRMLALQLQHAVDLGDRVDIQYGVDIQRTIPRTDSTITGRNENDDTIDELGAYLHGETRINDRLKFLLAARLDYSNRLTLPVLSPRVAAVYKASPAQTIRLSYNRAFSTPTTNDLFLDILADYLPTPIPIGVHLVGVPESGFTFKRDCAGLCMRSPYTPASLGTPSSYLPLDATLLWPVLTDTLLGRGIDIRALPVPTADQVATVMKILDFGTGRFNPISDVADIAPLRASVSNTVELGYTGIFGGRLQVGVDIFRTRRNNFISAERVATPSVFFDYATLNNFLSGFTSADTAALLASVIATVPVGTVTPEQAMDPYDLIVTYRNAGDVTLWGTDIQAAAFLTRDISVMATFSWTSKDTLQVPDGIGGNSVIALNSPGARGSFAARYANDELGLNGELRGRAARSFPVRSGVYVGTVEKYSVWDATLGYRIRESPTLTVTLSALNILNSEHREFVGAPNIGRLAMARIRAEF